MKKLFLFFLVTIVFSVHSQNLEQKYKVSENSPEWIKEMYSKSPNLKKVKEEYEKYYKSHEFIKNQHTQYYKRWLRENEPLVDNEGNIVLPTTEKLIKQRNDYNKQLLAKKILKSNGVANWEEIGPWEYDHVNPNLYPNDGTPLNYYWVLNNYGANTDFTVSSILFKNLDSISSDQAANPSRFNLFKRNENEDNDWGTLIDQGDSAVSSTQGNVTFSTGLNLTNTGQFIITDNTSTLTVDEDELNLNKDLLVYPTIASNSNTITIENNSNKKLDFTIYNLLGQKIMQLDNIGEKQLIKVNHFKPGVYLLKFISEDNIETSKKLIIN